MVHEKYGVLPFDFAQGQDDGEKDARFVADAYGEKILEANLVAGARTV